MTPTTPEQEQARRQGLLHAQAHGDVERRAYQVAFRLEDAAAQIRKAIEDPRPRLDLSDMRPQDADLVRVVVHRVLNTMGNLDLDGLVMAASAADRIALGHGAAEPD